MGANLFGFNFDLDFESDDKPTWPVPGTALLKIEDKFEPLFTSATWTIVATVDGGVIAKSRDADHPHSKPFIRRWSRQMIRTQYESLRRLGVDAEKEYVALGGDLYDLQSVP